MKAVLAYGTLKNYYTTAKYLKLFIRGSFNLSDFFLSKLNYQFIIEFEMFLRRHKPVDHQKALQNNGVTKHLERLKKLSNLAFKMEWIDKNPFERYLLKFARTERSFLTIEELQRIEQKKFCISRLEYVKDLFVFSCYTSLTYIDVMQLNPTSVVEGSDDTLWIKTSRQKTGTQVNIPLLSKAIYVIEKYKNDIRVLSKDALLPYISNQKL